jgi:hypothetical protein
VGNSPPYHETGPTFAGIMGRDDRQVNMQPQPATRAGNSCGGGGSASAGWCAKGPLGAQIADFSSLVGQRV